MTENMWMPLLFELPDGKKPRSLRLCKQLSKYKTAVRARDWFS